MKKHLLVREQFVPRPIGEVFAFFARPENLAWLTPPSLGFRILTPPPIVMRRGTIIDYAIRVAGIPIRWRSMITAYEPEREFVDEQINGPYSFWHHRHAFTALGDGTLICDSVEYVVPLGAAGNLLVAPFIRRRLTAIFDYRKETIERLFASGALRTAGTPAQKEGVTA